jgi:hypothetical protein
MAVDTWGWYETSEPLEKLKRREHEFGAAVRCRLGYPTFGGQPIDEPRLWRAERDDPGGGVESLQSKGRTSTVPEQPFDTCSVFTLDADGRVDTEPTGALPGKHAVGVGLVEESVATEVAQDTALDDVL